MSLKPITREGIPSALKKVERYRLLNDAVAAESICLDVLALDPEHQPLAEHMAQRLQDLGPEAWMEDTRLVRGLRSELARRGDVALG